MINPERSLLFVEKMQREAKFIIEQLKKIEVSKRIKTFYPDGSEIVYREIVIAVDDIYTKIDSMVNSIMGRIASDFDEKYNEKRVRVEEFLNFTTPIGKKYSTGTTENIKSLISMSENIIQYLDHYKKDIENEGKRLGKLLEAELNTLEAKRRQAVAKYKEAGLDIERIERKRGRGKKPGIHFGLTEKKK